MNRTRNTILTTVYGIGTAAVFVLLMLVLFRSSVVLNPDAMLPMELHELASIWLALGSIPMLVFSALLYDIHKREHGRRSAILLFLPSAVCLAFDIYWICIMVIGLVTR